MNETERNYKIYDWELLVIMEGLKQWRQYLIGRDQFEIWTDHKNLGYFKKPQKLNHHQARWTTELQEYNFQLVHKPGSSQKKVDALSRRPDGVERRMVPKSHDSRGRILERNRRS